MPCNTTPKNPIIEFNGVRSSCYIDATNFDLIWAADSVASLALIRDASKAFFLLISCQIEMITGLPSASSSTLRETDNSKVLPSAQLKNNSSRCKLLLVASF